MNAKSLTLFLAAVLGLAACQPADTVGTMPEPSDHGYMWVVNLTDEPVSMRFGAQLNDSLVAPGGALPRQRQRARAQLARASDATGVLAEDRIEVGADTLTGAVLVRDGETYVFHGFSVPDPRPESGGATLTLFAVPGSAAVEVAWADGGEAPLGPDGGASVTQLAPGPRTVVFRQAGTEVGRLEFNFEVGGNYALIYRFVEGRLERTIARSNPVMVEVGEEGAS